MSTLCAFPACKRASRVLCYVCHESLCREHYDEHDHSFNLIINSLNDQLKECDDRLEELNNEELIENYLEKLDKWRDESYQTIDRLYEKKCRELKTTFSSKYR